MAGCADLDHTATGISMDVLQRLRSGLAGWVEVLHSISTGADTLDGSSRWIGRFVAEFLRAIGCRDGKYAITKCRSRSGSIG